MGANIHALGKESTTGSWLSPSGQQVKNYFPNKNQNNNKDGDDGNENVSREKS